MKDVLCLLFMAIFFLLAYTCDTSETTNCSSCVAQTSRTQDNQCDSCHADYTLSGVDCVACVNGWSGLDCIDFQVLFTEIVLGVVYC